MQEKDAVSPTLLVSLLASLPRLEHLQTWNISVPSPLTTHALDEHVSVREVCIDYGKQRPMSLEICGLLTCFKKVESLNICEPTWHPVGRGRDRNDELTDDFPLSTSLDVESLTLAAIYNYPPLLVIPKFMSRSQSAHNLRRFALHGVSHEAVGAVQNVVQTLGPHLEYFEITFLEPSMSDYAVLLGVC